MWEKQPLRKQCPLPPPRPALAHSRARSRSLSLSIFIKVAHSQSLKSQIFPQIVYCRKQQYPFSLPHISSFLPSETITCISFGCLPRFTSISLNNVPELLLPGFQLVTQEPFHLSRLVLFHHRLVLSLEWHIIHSWVASWTMATLPFSHSSSVAVDKDRVYVCVARVCVLTSLSVLYIDC